jgi:type VI protein secretion system component VasK
MRGTTTAYRLAPYAKQLAENEYARENLRRGAENLRAAYERSQKRRVKNAKDEKLHHQLEAALAQLSEGTRALATRRQKPKPRWPKRLAVVGLVGAAAAGIAVTAGDEIKSALGMGGEQEPGA